MLAAVLAVGVNLLASLLLSGIVTLPLPLGLDMRSGMGFRGLALANSIAALVEAGVLLRFAAVRMPGLTSGQLTAPALRILAASLVMGVSVAWLAGRLDPLLGAYGAPGQALLIAFCVGSGAVLYGVLSLAFRSDEVSALWRLVRRQA